MIPSPHYVCGDGGRGIKEGKIYDGNASSLSLFHSLIDPSKSEAWFFRSFSFLQHKKEKKNRKHFCVSPY